MTRSRTSLRARSTSWAATSIPSTQCSGKYLPGKDEAYIAAQAFEGVSPGFASRFRPGGIIAAGTHFGINSSREQAVHILHRLGVTATIAPSFGRQFLRNAINNGLLLIEFDPAGLAEGDMVTIDLANSELAAPARGARHAPSAAAADPRHPARKGAYSFPA